MNGTQPVGLALVLCDNIYHEPTGKRALVGLFSHIRVKGFPAEHGRLAIYVALTAVRKTVKCRLDIVCGEDETAVVEVAGEIAGSSPLEIHELHFILPRLVFNEAGVHFVRFFADDSPVLQRPFNVVDSIEKKKKNPNKDGE